MNIPNIFWIILALGLLYIVWSQRTMYVSAPMILSDDIWSRNYYIRTPWRGRYKRHH